MQIDCVVLTKDRPDLMMDLRDGLLKQQGVELTVCVVDNGDEPKTFELVKQWGKSDRPELLWAYVHEKIKGFGAGVNLGASVVADAPLLLVLNNDVGLTDPWMLYGMAHHVGPAGVKIVGARMVDENGLVNHDGVSFVNGQPMHLGRGLPTAANQICGLTPSTTFACALIDRELFDNLGGVDESYGWGYEDTDFCLRAAELDALTVTCRRTSARHDEFGTRTRGGDLREQQWFHGKWAVTGRGERALKRFSAAVSNKGF